jgi:leucyl aminopeptidase
MKIQSVTAFSDKDTLVLLVSTASFKPSVAGLKGKMAETASSRLKEAKDPVVLDEFTRYIILVPVPEADDRTRFLEGLRKLGQAVQSVLKSKKQHTAQVLDVAAGSAGLMAFCEGLVLSSYSFTKYFSDPKVKETYPSVLKIKGDVHLNELKGLTDAVFLARNLVNEPYMHLGTGDLAACAVEVGKNFGIKVEVFTKKKIETLKMGGLLAVNRASKDDPAFIVMEYKPKGAANAKPLVLVGKGVVYDTGGASLKSSAGMTTMKCDMAGAAAVIGAMQAFAAGKLPVYAVGLIPVTDNLIDAHSVVPGDVITMSSGKTVEILNTDAEGRLILADALHYAKKYNPELVIDLATLTGAAARAIGEYGIAAHEVNSAHYKFALEDAGAEVYERLVWFPMWDEYGDMIKSDVADIKNLGGADAGMITAAKFLQHFTDYPWIHLDIAGPAFLERTISYRGKGGTGVGVRLLYTFAAHYFLTEKSTSKKGKK